MRTKVPILLLIIILFVILQNGCEDSPTEPSDRDTTIVGVFKPNIYIYPTNKMDLAVNISFPLGGKVTESIPEYNTGWNVSVEPTGIINGEYEYLFYECDVPDLFQKERGWLIKKSELELFFKGNLRACGFSGSEIKDFIDYWIPRLIDSNYYEIYPQYRSEIEEMVVLNFFVEPENIFRLFYYIKGRDNSNISLPIPNIGVGKRENYYVMEWGVIIK